MIAFRPPQSSATLADRSEMDKIIEENCVDIFGTVNMLRRQRSTIVQTEEQYILCYQAAQEAIASINTEVSVRNLPKHVSNANANARASEWKRLSDTPPNVFARRDSGAMAENRGKNRYQQVLPLETTRVRLGVTTRPILLRAAQPRKKDGARTGWAYPQSAVVRISDHFHFSSPPSAWNAGNL